MRPPGGTTGPTIGFQGKEQADEKILFMYVDGTWETNTGVRGKKKCISNVKSTNICDNNVLTCDKVSSNFIDYNKI